VTLTQLLGWILINYNWITTTTVSDSCHSKQLSLGYYAINWIRSLQQLNDTLHVLLKMWHYTAYTLTNTIGVFCPLLSSEFNVIDSLAQGAWTMPTKTGRISLALGSNFGNRPSCCHQWLIWVPARVEPRLARRKSVILTTKPRLLLILPIPIWYMQWSHSISSVCQ